MENYKAGKITFVKFMTKEEFLEFITEVHNFRIKTKDGQILKSDRTYIHGYQKYCDSTNIKLKSLDYEDVLICGSGYVRYHGQLGSGYNRELVYLFEHYGFEVER